jgi:DNA-directed RNA polymerase subunit H (RpoH/RPB5)
MSNEIIDQDDQTPIGEVVYDREIVQVTEQPEFKPGNTPYTQFGNQTLNANIHWHLIVEEILAHYTQEQLVDEAGIKPASLPKILKQNYRRLNFKTGAKLLSIHSQLYPQLY